MQYRFVRRILFQISPNVPQIVDKGKAKRVLVSESFRTLATLSRAGGESLDAATPIHSGRVVGIEMCNWREIALAQVLRFPFAYLANKRRKVVITPGYVN